MLVRVFLSNVVFWAIALIILPQVILVGKSLTLPTYKLESTKISGQITTLDTCILILEAGGQNKFQCTLAEVETLSQAEEQKRQKEADLKAALEKEASSSPYTPHNYLALFQNPLSLSIMVSTIVYGLVATVLCLIMCYPIAYSVALASKQDTALWVLTALLTPYFTVEVVRIYAWLSIVDYLNLTRYSIAVFLVVVYTYILFMFFPIYNALSSMDRNQIRAAQSLGASWITVHRRVIIPHAKAGIVIGCVTTFMLSATTLSVPRIISRGLQGDWFSQTIYSKFFESPNWSIGSAYAITFTVCCLFIVAVFMAVTKTSLRSYVND